MEPELEQIGGSPSVIPEEISAPQESGTDLSPADISGEAPTPVPAAPEPTDEQITAYLEKLDHDGLKRIPAYNKQLIRGLEKQRTEFKKENDQNQLLLQWDGWFQNIEPRVGLDPADPDQIRRQGQFSSAMQDPNVQAWYNAVRNYRQNSSREEQGRRQALLNDILSRIHGYFSVHPDFTGKIDDWDALTQSSDGDPATFVQELIARGIANEKKRLAAESKEQVKAEINKLAAKYGLSLDQPDSPPAGAAGNGYKRYADMTTEERAALTPAQRDALTAQLLR